MATVLAKTDRNEELADYADQHSEMGMAAVGKHFDLTRQRAQQVYAAVRGRSRAVHLKATGKLPERVPSTVCPAVIQSGKRKGHKCGRPVKKSEGAYCKLHLGKGYLNGQPRAARHVTRTCSNPDCTAGENGGRKVFTTLRSSGQRYCSTSCRSRHSTRHWPAVVG